MFFGLIKKPVEPCNGDFCLVRSACFLKREQPWNRRTECTMYKEYRKDLEKYRKIENKYESFIYYIAIGILISVAIAILGIFCVGLVTVCRWIWPWIF